MVKVNGTTIVENATLTLNPCEVTIPEGENSVPVEIEYEFEWDTPGRLKKYGSWEAGVRLFLQAGGIPDSLLNQKVYGKKKVIYNVDRADNYKNIVLSFAGWEEKAERIKYITSQHPSKKDKELSSNGKPINRNDLFQCAGIQKIDDIIDTGNPPTPDDLFTN